MSKYLNLKKLLRPVADPQAPETIRTRNKMMVVMAAVVVVGVIAPHFICVTTTASLRERVYLLSHSPSKLARKDFVIFRHANYATSYKPQNLMKQIVCDEGDDLRVTGEKEYYCNDQYLGRAKDKSLKGEPIANFVFNGRIPAGKMFVMGHHRDSFDSRYEGMGLLDKEIVTAKGYPLI